MNNCVILGMGRSGTSSLAGLLAQSGYYLGTDLLKSTSNNPKGYFESRKINFLNEDILELNTFTRPIFLGRYFFRSKPVYGQRWLSKIRLDKEIKSSEKINKSIESMIDSFDRNQPFAIKDPRFNFTLNIWENLFKTAPKKICLFRQPINTAKSVLKFTRKSGDSKVLDLDLESVLDIWNNQYQFILENLYNRDDKEDWLFIHFDQLLDRSAYAKIEQFLEIKLKSDGFIERRISQQDSSESSNSILYQKLCDLANYE